MNKFILITAIIIFSLIISLVCLFIGYSNQEKTNNVEISINSKIEENAINNTQINNKQIETENDILEPVALEISDLRNKEFFVIRGTATSNVYIMSVSINSENCTPYSINIPNFQHEDHKWELEASNNINDTNNSALICFGENEYIIHFGEIKDSRDSYNYTDKKITFFSDVGYDEVAHSDTAQKIKQFIKNKDILVLDDKSIITEFDLNEACEKMNLTDRGSLKENTDIIPLTQIANSKNLYAKVRGSVKNKDKNLIGIGGWGDDLLEYSGTHILEFYEKENENFIIKKGLPAINGWECMFPGKFKVYYYNPTMIIVAVSGGHEASPVNLYFDGEKWNSLKKLILKELNYSSNEPAVYLAPMNIVANKNYFSMIEYKYCCDTTFWLYPNKKTELIFDANTKNIVDVKLYKQDNSDQ